MHQVNSEILRENLEKIVGRDDSTFSGFDLATLIRNKYGRSYDVQLIKKVSFLNRWNFMRFTCPAWQIQHITCFFLPKYNYCEMKIVIQHTYGPISKVASILFLNIVALSVSFKLYPCPCSWNFICVYDVCSLFSHFTYEVLGALYQLLGVCLILWNWINCWIKTWFDLLLLNIICDRNSWEEISLRWMSCGSTWSRY